MDGQDTTTVLPTHVGGTVPTTDVAHVSLPYSADEYRSEIKRVKRKRRIVAVLLVLLALLVAAVVAAVVVLRIPGSLYTANSDVMAPVVVKGQTVITQPVGIPSSGDVIVYRDSSGAVQFARVVAVAGEWVNVSSDDKIVVSNAALDGNAAEGVAENGSSIIASRQIPRGSCFVMTDAESEALDALYREDSFIAYNNVLGRAWFRVWPITSMGPVS